MNNTTQPSNKEMKMNNTMKVGDLIKLTPLVYRSKNTAVAFNLRPKNLRIHLQRGELLFAWDPETDENIALMPSCPDAKTAADIRWDNAQVWDVTDRDGQRKKRKVIELLSKSGGKVGNFWMAESLGHISQSVAETIAHPAGGITTIVI